MKKLKLRILAHLLKWLHAAFPRGGPGHAWTAIDTVRGLVHQFRRDPQRRESLP